MRRIFSAIVAGLAVAWPFEAGAQVVNKPVIGFLGAQSPDTELLAKFREGLGEFGYFEGRNVEIDYRWANNQNEKLNAMAASLAQRQVALIVTTGGMVSARAAKNATAEIPILFVSGLDPVENGLVESLSHPGGNITGISLFYREIIPKRLEVLKQTLPNVKSIAYLQNDDGTGLGSNEKFQFKAETAMANQLGLVVYYARNEPDLEPAFAAMAQRHTDAMLVGSDPFFTNHRKQLVELAAKYSLPAAYQQRQFVDTGGLMSYGPSNREAWREIGQYAGRVLKGAPPKDLPVMMQSRFELAINMQTAKALGLPVPPLVHALADDVIE